MIEKMVLTDQEKLLLQEIHLSSVRHFFSSFSSQRPYLEYPDFLHFLTHFMFL